MKKFSVWCLALVLVCSAIATARAPQNTKTLKASKNNSLFENPQGNTSDGAGPAIFVGCLFVPENCARRGLIAFDVAASIPKRSKITEVTLKLTLERAPNEAGQLIELRRVLSDWGEGGSNTFGGMGADATRGDATWLYSFYKTRKWKTAGGDFSDTASGEQTVSSLGVYTFASTPQMVADVQSWLDAPQKNFGWLLFGKESEQGTLKIFASRHSTNISARPQLTIKFRRPGK
ncbi:MAG: DNRLRE domain-containing protein [Acidobacteria bacterium]|nr:DNRLRE domain-containing protein [Acidobacteriota bacterium]